MEFSFASRVVNTDNGDLRPEKVKERLSSRKKKNLWGRKS